MTTVLYCCPSVLDCSSSPTALRQAIHAQQNSLISYCQQQHFSVDAIYTDVVPAKCMYNRPAFLNLIADARNHRCANLICPSIETLCLNPNAQRSLLRFLKRHNVNVMFAPSA